MKISPHFTDTEAKCKCGCGQTIINPYLLGIIENARGHFGKPYKVNSWNRCAKYNKKVGGAPRSLHVTGQAVDGHIPGVALDELYNYYDKLLGKSGGVIIYPTFVHVDCRKGYWRDKK